MQGQCHFDRVRKCLIVGALSLQLVRRTNVDAHKAGEFELNALIWCAMLLEVRTEVGTFIAQLVRINRTAQS
jgi:hypothetical protein